MKHPISALLILGMVLLSSAPVLAEDAVVSAERMAGWKLTKSLSQPAVVEKIRKGLGVKGLGVETGPSATADATTAASAVPTEIEVKVDAASAFSFQNIQFALNSAELTGTTTFQQLAEIAKAMEMASKESFLIEGHTCDLGDDPSNFELSYRRALSVKSVLAGLGVSESRLQVLGLGESDRLVKDSAESARIQNRRVEIYRKL